MASFVQNNGVVGGTLIGSNNTGARVDVGGSGQATYTINGGTLYYGFGGLNIGSTAASSFVQTGGTVQAFNSANDAVNVAPFDGTGGSVRIAGGTFTAGPINVGVAGAGTFAHESGTVSTPALGIATNQLSPATGSYTLTGGNAALGNVTIGNRGRLEQADGTLTAASLTFGTSTVGFGGDLLVSGGTTTVNIALTLANRGLLTYSGGAITAGSLNMTTTGGMLFDIDPADLLDPISITGAAAFNGTLSLDLPAGTTDPFGSLEELELLDAGSTITGAFTNVASGARLSTDAGSFLVSYGSGSPFGADKLVLSDFQSIPEPVTALWLACVVPVVLARRRPSRAV